MRRLLTVLLVSTIALAACSQAPAPNGQGGFPTQASNNSGNGNSAAAATQTDSPTETAAPSTVAAAAPTQDFSSYLLTQAYSAFTPQPGATEIVVTPTATATTSPAGGSGSSRPTAIPPTALPADLFVKEPIQIAGAVNTATCTIRNIGDCTKTMSGTPSRGPTVDVIFTFGFTGDQVFKWGDAAVSVTKDGKQIAWSQVGNMYVKPPDFTKNESWSIKVGQTAQFDYGLENLQPGHYTVRLAMCTSSPQDCANGQGWQNVGGDAVDFNVVAAG